MCFKQYFEDLSPNNRSYRQINQEKPIHPSPSASE